MIQYQIIHHRLPSVKNQYRLEPIMHSFDDYYYFYLVVKHGGFSAASDASNITKSKLSRRILDLEAK